MLTWRRARKLFLFLGLFLGIGGGPEATLAGQGRLAELRERARELRAQRGQWPMLLPREHVFVGHEGPAAFYPQRTRSSRQTPLRQEINLTNDPAEDLHPAWSPNGETIAFSSNRDGTYDLWLMNPDGSNLRKLTNDPSNARYPAWAPSGTKIAFSSDRNGVSDIYVIDLVTKAEQRITQNLGNATHPTWSPGGDRIVFATTLNGSHIWSINIDGSGARALTNGPSIDTDPQWSADGLYIAFTSNGRDRNRDGQIDASGPDKNVWVMDPDGQNQVQVTFDAAEDTDPAWLEDWQTGSVSDFLLFVSSRGGNPDLYRVDRGGLAPVLVSPPGNAWVDVDPSPDPDQLRQPRTAFTSRRTGNNDIWLLRIEDLNPPVLSDGTRPVLPTVSPRQTVPGGQVTIEAAVYDGESGVAEVYALFKLPDQPIYTGFPDPSDPFWTTGEHFEDLIEGDANGRGIVAHELDYRVVSARDYSLQDPVSEAFAFWSDPDYDPLAFVRAHGLRLFDDGPLGRHGDRRAGDGVYTGVWTTPPQAQDYYVDFVPVDRMGNYPFGLVDGPGILGMNLMFMLARGYDHLAGFTTRPFGTTNKILFVSDYACGQKFQGMWNLSRPTGDLWWYWPGTLPVESYYFDYPEPQLVPSDGRPVVGFEYPFGFRAPAFGWWENVDLWRVLCRGPLDYNTLSAYLPVPVDDALAGPASRLHAEKMVVWASPYTGDLWVGPGTLLDVSMQDLLMRFLDEGGRLFITGQDIGWALTLNGTKSNPFFTNYLRAQFVSDAAGDVISVPQIPLLRHELGGGVTAGTAGEPFNSGLNPISQEAWQFHWRIGSTDFYPDSLVLATPENTNYPWDWPADAATNQWFVDDIQPANNSAVTYSYSSGGADAAVRYIDAATGARVVYFAFGFEAIDNRYSQQTISNVNVVLSHSNRYKLARNISNYLRTGTIRGRVVGMDGQTPAAGALVQAQLFGQIVGAAYTLSDGTYSIPGLNAGIYIVNAQKPGFTADHIDQIGLDAGEVQYYHDIRLLQLTDGVIKGTVTELDGVTAIAGATVTAMVEGAPPGSTPLTLTTTTLSDGTYTISGVPAATYTVMAGKEGYSTEQQTGVKVDPGVVVANIDLQLAPGPGSISGQVVQAGKRTPIANATVTVLKGTRKIAEGTTDNQGRYKLDPVPAGTYDVRASATGFQVATLSNVVVNIAQETTNVDFELEPLPPGKIVGRVTNAANGDPVGGALVELLLDGVVLQTVTSEETFRQDDANNLLNYEFADVPAGTYDVQVTASGFAKAQLQDIRVRQDRTTANVDFRLEPLHIFARGLAMVSAPADYTKVAPDIGLYLDDDGDRDTPLRLATYDVAARSYVFYPTPPAHTFTLGRGYWLQLSRAASFTREGMPAAAGRAYALPLQVGWNMIGDPFDYPVDWQKTQVRLGTQTVSLAKALAQGWVSNALYTYTFGQYRMVFRLDPWAGYWVRAFQPVELLIDPTEIPRGVPPLLAEEERGSPTPKRWQVELIAQAPGAAPDEGNIVGVATQATKDFDPGLDQEEPPPAPVSGYVRLSFPHQDWGVYAGRYRQDVQGEAPTMEWDLEVETDLAQTPITLRWPRLARSLPDEVALKLIDLETGQEQLLRTRTHYTYPSGPTGGVRRFRLRAEARVESGLAITQVQVRPRRGRGMSVSYTLSGDATMEVWLTTPGGRLIKRLQQNTPVRAGLQTVDWDGADAAGRPLPAGVYLLALQGQAPDGQTVRVLRTLTWRP